jgi:MFS family permease
MGSAKSQRQFTWPLLVLLVANAVSLTGNMLTTLAVPWFVLQTTGSVTSTGLAAFASTLPIMISATFAGALVDRIGRRRSSVLSDLMSGVIVALIPMLYLTTGLGFVPLLALLFVRWLLATPGETARDALLLDIAEREDVRIERATAAYEGVSRGARMVGAPLAGVLIAWLGPTPLLFVDGATFLLSAVLLCVGVPRTRQENVEQVTGGYLERLRAGLAFLWHDRLLRAVVIMIVVTNMLDIGIHQVLLPVYARDVLHDARALGLLEGSFSTGAVVGTVAYGAFGGRLPRRLTFAMCFFVGSVPRISILVIDLPLVLVIGVTFVSGIAAGAINPLLGVVQFERIPVALRARVLGAVIAGAFAAMPIGGLLAGSLTELIGLTATLLAFGSVYLAACMMPFIGRVWRDLDMTSAEPVNVSWREVAS